MVCYFAYRPCEYASSADLRRSTTAAFVAHDIAEIDTKVRTVLAEIGATANGAR
jgi:hypothetical protein